MLSAGCLSQHDRCASYSYWLMLPRVHEVVPFKVLFLPWAPFLPKSNTGMCNLQGEPLGYIRKISASQWQYNGVSSDKIIDTRRPLPYCSFLRFNLIRPIYTQFDQCCSQKTYKADYRLTSYKCWPTSRTSSCNHSGRSLVLAERAEICSWLVHRNEAW